MKKGSLGFFYIHFQEQEQYQLDPFYSKPNETV